MKKKTLIVEDNPKALNIVKRILKEIDPEIIIYEATNADVAYRFAMQKTIDLFILDII